MESCIISVLNILLVVYRVSHLAFIFCEGEGRGVRLWKTSCSTQGKDKKSSLINYNQTHRLSIFLNGKIENITLFMLDVPVFIKANEIVQRDFNCKLSSWTRGGVAKQGTRMVCLYYVLYWFPSRDPANFQIKYRINWSFFPLYVQLANDILLIKNKISNTPRHI